MKIYLLIFFLCLAIGVSSIEKIHEERVNAFVANRLIPILKKSNVSLHYDRLRLCLCSTEIGCSTRTSGWVGSVLRYLEKEEIELYQNTCFTDGECYQNARPYPEIPYFGCYDDRHRTMENEFHDQSGDMCKNTTATSVWICCGDGHYCANETIVELPPTPMWLWSISDHSENDSHTIFFIFVPVGMIIGGLYIFWKQNCKEKYTTKWADKLKKLICRHTDKPKNTENRIEMGDRCEETCETRTTLLSGDNSKPEQHLFGQLPKNFRKMLRLLDDDDSGSGAGALKLTDITLGRQIEMGGFCGSGKSGTVNVGMYCGGPVAVKKFLMTEADSFDKELKIYVKSCLRHDNILRLIGYDSLDRNLAVEHMLVLEYHRHGSLHDYLSVNTVNLETWYSLMRSTCNGLAYLHMKVVNGSFLFSQKQRIAHRDIKSRNIMVRDNLTCAIGDFGLSVAESTEPADIEALKRSGMCGTVRYLAPEILAGTINRSSFDSFLNADIYAMSLVMWETLCRYKDETIAPMTGEVMPYGYCTNRLPSDDEMRKVILEDKMQLETNPLWFKNDELKEIWKVIQVCWNPNPHARYTAYNCRKKLDDKAASLFPKKEEALYKEVIPTKEEEEIQRNKEVTRKQGEKFIAIKK